MQANFQTKSVFYFINPFIWILKNWRPSQHQHFIFPLSLPLLGNSGKNGVVIFYPCLFCPCDNVWRSWCPDAPWCEYFSTVITPSWITQQISVEKWVHLRRVSALGALNNVQNCHLDITNMDKTSQPPFKTINPQF